MKQVRRRRHILCLGLTLTCLCFAANPVGAASISFFGEDGLGRSASATFARSGDNLVVTLTNTSQADVVGVNDVLTAVFFGLPEAPSDPNGLLGLPRVSAVVGQASNLALGNNPSIGGPGFVVDQGFAYARNPNGFPGTPPGSTRGISAATFGTLFENSNFPTDGGTPLLGIGFGLTSAGDDPLTGVSGSVQLIKNQAVFTLMLNGPGAATFDPKTGVSNVSFQYGESLDGPNIKGVVPEPTTLLLLGSGMVGIGMWRWKQAKVNKR